MGAGGWGVLVSTSLEGRHRVTYSRWAMVILAGLPVLFWVNAALYGSWSARAAWLGVGFLALLRALAAFVWCPQTVVTPQRLRIREGWRSRELTWDDVESVHGPSRWRLRREVTVLPIGESWLPLPGIPEDRADEVRAYWQAHRSPT